MTAPLPYGLRQVDRMRDAVGAVCIDPECGQVFTADSSPYWSWDRSAAAHRIGTGHATRLFSVADVACSSCQRRFAVDPRGDALDSSGRCDACRP